MFSAHTDMELASSLAEKISLLEQKIEKQAQEIQLKVKVSLFLSLPCPLPWEFHLSGLVWAQKFICGLLLIIQMSSLQSNRAVGSGLRVAEGTVPAGTSCSSDSQHAGTKISSSLASDFFFPPVVVHSPFCFLKQQLLTQQSHPRAALSASLNRINTL